MTFLESLPGLIEDAEKRAGSGCGQSDVLYEKFVQDAYAAILGRAPEGDRDKAEQLLKSRGFDPEFVPYEAQEGECDLTGIEIDCCPCGRHE